MSAATMQMPTDAEAEAASSEVLTFTMGKELFAMEVARVQEILDDVSVTRVPNADPFAPGVINVRGHVVPLVDLRRRFGLPDRQAGTAGRTVVFEVMLEEERTKVAMSVDVVRDVTPLGELKLEDIPEIGTRWNRAFVKGIARAGQELIVVLDLENIFTLSTDNK